MEKTLLLFFSILLLNIACSKDSDLLGDAAYLNGEDKQIESKEKEESAEADETTPEEEAKRELRYCIQSTLRNDDFETHRTADDHLELCRQMQLTHGPSIRVA